MGDVIRFKIPKASEKFRGRALCRSGLHKWEILKDGQFDVREGKLITVFRCVRCGMIRSQAI
ncbi:MAG: hypothetical protein ACU833_08315 [Gammaproteobacteria bacterium]